MEAETQPLTSTLGHDAHEPGFTLPPSSQSHFGTQAVRPESFHPSFNKDSKTVVFMVCNNNYEAFQGNLKCDFILGWGTRLQGRRCASGGTFRLSAKHAI